METQLILRQLQKRLGNIDSQLESQLSNLSFSELENLGLDLLDFNSVSDLVNWLNSLTRDSEFDRS